MDEDKPLLTIFIIIIFSFVISIGVLFVTVLLHDSKKEFMEDFEKNLVKRTELVELVETYQLEYNEDGLITNLDKVGLSGLAANDRVYVRYQEEEFIVEFVINSGFPDEGQSLFYSSGGKELLEEIMDESLYAKIELLEENWYFVQYN